MIEAKELKKIVRFCRRNDIVKFKSGDFEIEIGQKRVAKPAKSSQELVESPKEAFPSWDSLTPEQRLLWSSTPDIPTA